MPRQHRHSLSAEKREVFDEYMQRRAAIMSRRTAVGTLGWVDDTEKEIERIEEEGNAASGASMADLFNQEPAE